MKKSTIIVPAMAVIISGIIGFGSFAEARGGHWGGHGGYYSGMRGGPGMPAMTSEQQAAAQEIYQDFSTAANPLQQQIMSKRAELQAQMYSPAPDSKKIEDLSKEIGELKGKMLLIRSEMRGKMEKAGLPNFGPGYGFGGHMGGYGYGMGHGGPGFGRHGGYGMGHGGPGFGRHGGYGMGGYGPCGVGFGRHGGW